MVDIMARVESAAIPRTGLRAQPFCDIGGVRKSFRGNTDGCEFRNQESLMLVVSFINHFFFPHPVSEHQIILYIRLPKVGDSTTDVLTLSSDQGRPASFAHSDILLVECYLDANLI